MLFSTLKYTHQAYHIAIQTEKGEYNPVIRGAPTPIDRSPQSGSPFGQMVPARDRACTIQEHAIPDDGRHSSPEPVLFLAEHHGVRDLSLRHGAGDLRPAPHWPDPASAGVDSRPGSGRPLRRHTQRHARTRHAGDPPARSGGRHGLVGLPGAEAGGTRCIGRSLNTCVGTLTI